RGSLGLDLATAIDVTLIDQRPCKIPTAIRGPVTIDGHAHGALLLGRSSSGLKGLFILPGLIDADFTGEIFIVAQTSFPPIHIPKGSRIAQLVPLSQLTAAMQKVTHLTERGDKGFGS
ncbi:POK9 protein, partial [Origma solitaria]|nr:POK9 protein [Origma solitaria]